MNLHEVLFIGAWELIKKLYQPILSIALFVLALVLFTMLLSFNSTAQGTVRVTQAEMERFAQNNLERKQCLENQLINEQHIDSLELTVNYQKDLIALKDSTIKNYEHLESNYLKIDSMRVGQKNELKSVIKDQKKTIDKQNRRLNFWRIFTPSAITGVTILTLILK